MCVCPRALSLSFSLLLSSSLALSLTLSGQRISDLLSLLENSFPLNESWLNYLGCSRYFNAEPFIGLQSCVYFFLKKVLIFGCNSCGWWPFCSKGEVNCKNYVLGLGIEGRKVCVNTCKDCQECFKVVSRQEALAIRELWMTGTKAQWWHTPTTWEQNFPVYSDYNASNPFACECLTQTKNKALSDC